MKSAGEPLRLDQASDMGRSRNNFDLLRLAAALFIVFFHSFELTGTSIPFSFFPEKTNVTFGTAGVLIFFSLSGFLIARSWTYDPRVISYAVKRGLRLLPALFVSLFLTAFVLGPLVSDLSTSEYLNQPATKAYVVLNSAMWTVYQLPGVFTSNVVPNAVNGSLWTLSVEVKAYILIAVLGLFGVFRRRGGSAIVVAIALLTSLWTIDAIRNALPLGDRAVAMLFNTQANAQIVDAAANGAYNEWAKVFAAFAIGAALFSLRRWIWLRWDVAAALAVIWGITIVIGPDAAGHAAVFLIPFGVLMVAYRTSQWVRLPHWFGDYSYGIYILAFPIQQAIVFWIAPTSGWVMFLISAPIALGLAALSWHFIEAPALTLKKRIARPLDRAVDEGQPEPREQLEPIPVPS